VFSEALLGADAQLSLFVCLGCVVVVVSVVGWWLSSDYPVWCGVEFVLRSLFAASGSRLVFKILPSIKIWYAEGVLSKKVISLSHFLDIMSWPSFGEEFSFGCVNNIMGS
jgi:hypothetical protein